MSATQMFWEAPPVSRTLTAACFALSVLVYTGYVPGRWVIFGPKYLLTIPPQIWRLATCFLISGPNLSILLDPYFLYTYASRLEIASPKFTAPGDFFTYIVFVCLTILGLNTAFTGGVIFTQALILAMTYTACQDDRGSKSSFFVITIPTQWVPFAMLIMTFVMSGSNAALQQATGIVAAHLYDFLTRIYPEFGGGTNFIKTPLFVRRWFEPTVATASNRSYGMAFTPAAGQPAARGTGASTGGVLPESWKSRGSGHRLGGE